MIAELSRDSYREYIRWCRFNSIMEMSFAEWYRQTSRISLPER